MGLLSQDKQLGKVVPIPEFSILQVVVLFVMDHVIIRSFILLQVIQLQGDQQKNVSNFLVKVISFKRSQSPTFFEWLVLSCPVQYLQAGIVKKDQIKLHGF